MVVTVCSAQTQLHAASPSLHSGTFWGPLLRGDKSAYTPAHDRILALRKQALLDRGLVEGTDFVISDATGRAYMP